MNRIGYPLCLAIAAIALQGCENSTSGHGEDPGASKAGARRHKAPSVAYHASDSLVEIGMSGSREGDEASFWIYRNDSLLEMPDFIGRDSGSAYAYRLVDSLAKAGTYTYYVRYGSGGVSLSDKSPEFTYEYAGAAPSGRLRATLLSGSTAYPLLTVYPRSGSHPGGARFERKLGASGKAILLDSLEGGPMSNSPGAYQFVDTDFVAEDGLLYYRASVWNAADEEWLDPTAWDTLRIRNREWDYLPGADIRNLGTEVQARLLSLPPDGTQSKLYLCRNGSQSRSGREKVDSLSQNSLYQGAPAVLLDEPGDPGTYWYWVEAVDRWGRESLRSAPKSIRFTGEPIGPALAFVTASGSTVQGRFSATPAFASYVLQRARDTSGSAVGVDTLESAAGEVLVSDSPPASGDWYYRVVGLDADGKAGEPGFWSRVTLFDYPVNYGSLSATLLNKGDHVEATVASVYASYSSFQILYRSKYSSGKDSVAVDTVAGTPYSTGPKLEDKPPVGTWYYHVEQVPADPAGTSKYRSALSRIDFTGKRVGPSLQSVQVYGGYIAVTWIAEPDFPATILERSQEGKGGWTAIDTLPSGTSTRNDRPPEAGIWAYRTRGILPNLEATDPGPVMRTATVWVAGESWSYSITPVVTNLGSAVEATGYAASSAYGVVRLMRGPTADFKGGVAADSLRNVYNFSLHDVPPKGTWYYWVEQLATDPYGGYRSQAFKVEFTGAPEIVSLSKSSSGVQVNLPRIAAGDTLEIWRATAEPEKAAAYAWLRSVPGGGYYDYIVDDAVDRKTAAFYHYRLVSIHQGHRSDPGGFKTIYYEP
jgi:hypothetical protein